VKRLLLALASVLCLAAAAVAAELPTAEPAGQGIIRLDRISAYFTAEAAKKRIPGAVVMIARNGRVVYDQAFGLRDPATGAPMRTDSIFRIYSMTKPITGVAVLMLMQDGKISLSDPVSKYLPALKSMTVAVESADAQGRRVVSFVPAERQITIQDLLCHTSGITYGAGNSAAEQAMRQAGLGIQLGRGDGNPMSVRMTDQQAVEAIGKLPLKFQPGSAWVYGRSIDVLLALIEVVSGQRGDVFMQQRIFTPLGMTDTFFNVPPDKLDRVAQPGPDPETGETADLTDVTRRRIFLGGGEGLLSTAADYMRFALMLANGGEANGMRLLSRQAVALMTSDHIGPVLSGGVDFFPGPEYGFGLTVQVRTRPGTPGNVGEYGWSGAAGTVFWVDPKESLVPIMMIQAPRRGGEEGSAFRQLVYQSVAD
jgi:CubicO group peptidase (beta-lactamase class C family)